MARRAVRPRTSTGPGARAEVAQAVADGARRRCASRRLAASSGAEAEGQVGGQRGGVRAARAVRRAVRVALAGDPIERLAVEDEVLGLLAVAAGDDDDVGPERVQPRASSLRTSLAAAGRASTRASGTFGVITVARGSSSSASAARASSSSSTRARLGDHHGVDHDRGAGLEQVQRLVDRGDDLGRAEHADLHGVDADVVGTARTCSTMNGPGTG